MNASKLDSLKNQSHKAVGLYIVSSTSVSAIFFLGAFLANQLSAFGTFERFFNNKFTGVADKVLQVFKEEVLIVSLGVWIDSLRILHSGFTHILKFG